MERDITKPVSGMSTDLPPDPTMVDPVKVRLDRFRASMSTMQPYESSFKTAFKRKRKF